jgi:hypothetical protein
MTSNANSLIAAYEVADVEAESRGVSASEPHRVAGLRRAFLRTMGRLEEIIDDETKALQQHTPTDLRVFNHRKSHALLEMTRAMRTLELLPPDEESLASLQRLRGKLAKNLVVVESHLKAVRHISGIISRVIEADDSDGTYSARAFRPVARA